jgi:hypothetical protein
MTLLEGRIKTCRLPAFSALFWFIRMQEDMGEYDVVETIVENGDASHDGIFCWIMEKLKAQCELLGSHLECPYL